MVNPRSPDAAAQRRNPGIRRKPGWDGRAKPGFRPEGFIRASLRRHAEFAPDYAAMRLHPGYAAMSTPDYAAMRLHPGYGGIF